MRRLPFAAPLAVVALGGLALRVAYVLIARRDAVVWGDALGYHAGANALADGHGFIDPLRYDLSGIEVPSAIHPPVYTVYLAAWSLVGLDGPLAHRLASTLLGAGTVVVAGLLGRRLAGARAGIVAAAFAALYPHLWLNDGALLSESAGGLGVALSFLAVERYRAQPGVRRALEVGATFAVATLTRAELVMLFPLVALPLFLAVGPADAKERSRRLLAGSVAAAVLVGPWVAHNLTRFEEPVTISNGLGSTLLGGSCDAAFHGEKLGYWSDECPTVEYRSGPDEATLARWQADPEGTRDEVRAYLAEYVAGEDDESERDIASREAALEYIGDHKRRYVVVMAARVGRIWNVFRPAQNVRFDADIEGRGRAGAWAALVSYYALTALGVVGLARLRRAGRPIWHYLVLAGIVTVTTAVTFGIQRYRLPFDAVLPVLAAVPFGVPRMAARAARRT